MKFNLCIIVCLLGMSSVVANAGGNEGFQVPFEPYKIKTENHKDDDVVCERKGGPFPICCEGNGQFACFSDDAMNAIVEYKSKELWEKDNNIVLEPKGVFPSEVTKEEFLSWGPIQQNTYQHKLVMNRLASIEKHIEREDYNNMFETLWGISLNDVYEHLESSKSYPKTREWLKEKVCK